mmetsp:Transcript_49653/g.126486  ORF Transcript_49653/g.126486 Transcript_49653/m.126486 type:complete len:218 (-) Transcript_49653:287-940(-)
MSAAYLLARAAAGPLRDALANLFAFFLCLVFALVCVFVLARVAAGQPGNAPANLFAFFLCLMFAIVHLLVLVPRGGTARATQVLCGAVYAALFRKLLVPATAGPPGNALANLFAFFRCLVFALVGLCVLCTHALLVKLLRDHVRQVLHLCLQNQSLKPATHNLSQLLHLCLHDQSLKPPRGLVLGAPVFQLAVPLLLSSLQLEHQSFELFRLGFGLL